MARRKRRDTMAPLQRNQPPQPRGPVTNNQVVGAFNADAEVAELDVVIPVYGRPDLLQQCLIGLEASCIDVDYRLYVVDDASPNPSEMAIVYNSLPPNSRLKRQTQNRGFPFTANHGVSLGASRSLLLLNSDVVLKAGAVRSMLDMLWTSEPPVDDTLDADPKASVGVVGPKLIFPEDSTDPSRPPGKIQHAGMHFALSGEPRHSYIGWSADTPRANVPTSIQCVTGACLMTRRQVWQDIHHNYKSMGDTATNGALNVVYGRGTFEDMEFCIAARSLGFKVVYQPLAVGSHMVGCSIMQDEEGYPLRQNSNIFKARAGHMIQWDHYRHC